MSKKRRGRGRRLRRIPVENHKTFLNVGSYSLAKPMNDLLLEQLDPQEVTLYGCKWNVPSPRFDALFLALHAMQHYGCGMRLHHLLDWACLLKKYGWCVPDEVKDRRLLRFMYGLTRLCNEFLGLRVAVGDDGGISREMLAAMLHPRYVEKVPVKGKGAILLYKTRRLLYQHALQRKAVGGSLRRRLWRSIVAHVRAPHTIFLTGREK